MQAILLLAHKGIDYITEFCKQFNNDNDFQIYIHQDIKNKISERDIENLKRQFTNTNLILVTLKYHYLKLKTKQ